MAAQMGGDDGFTGINITPMVDIILVLLVIFMVTTSTISRIEGLDVDRPDAATGRSMPQEDTTIVLTCGPDGEVEVDGQAMNDSGRIRSAIDARRASTPNLTGLIVCDEQAHVRAMVRLLDLLREAGVQDYAIATEQPQTTKG